MKRWLFAAVSGGLIVGAASAQEAKKVQAPAPAATKAAAPAPVPVPAGFETVQKQASYGLGYSLGKNFQSQGVSLDVELMVKGLRDGLGAAKSALSEAQMEEALRSFQQELIAKQEAESKAAAEVNLKKSAAFLAENGKKPGVKATKSGLQVKVLTEGTGALPKETDVVKVHYKGTLSDGTVFDSSYERGEPATFPVNQVIKGWIEALQMMKVGSKCQVTIPSELAYGATPPPGSPIPPNAVLQFEIELLGIEKPAPATKGAAVPK